MSNVIRTLSTKPWLTGQDAITGVPLEIEAFDLPEQKVGLRVFFVVATSLFLLFIVGYRMRMVYEDWVPLQEPLMLWANTGILVLASVALQLAKNAAAAGNEARTRMAFYLGGVLTAGFVIGQLLVWQTLSYTGHIVSSNPASSFFYLITAIHGLHILGGLAAWGRTVMRMHSHVEFEKVRMGVDLCTVYWHFLLIVWGVLFYMLLST